MKKIAIFGHRGVGKSAFLRRLKEHLQIGDQKVFDLDAEIEKNSGKPLPEIFSQEGEAQFRRIELQVFEELYQKHKTFVIGVGGGFPVAKIPDDVHCIWLQRTSDRNGRIFLDRPRLNPEISDLEEFLIRAQSRQLPFAARANERYLMPEGLTQESKTALFVEKKMFSQPIPFSDSCFFTLPPWLTLKNSHCENYLTRIATSGWELRTDWLPLEQMQRLLSLVLPQTLLVSFRTLSDIDRTQDWLEQLKLNLKTPLMTDWALELGEPAPHSFPYTILSLHEPLEQEDLSAFLKRLEKYSSHAEYLKAAPLVNSWQDLETLWRWQAEDPKKRSVLPRSKDGRWQWFRLFMKGKQRINFWKDSEGSAADQPSLYQWLATPLKPTRFAAVLGAPVELSRTPLEQQDFFDRQDCPVFAIHLTELEWQKGFPFLDKLGLVAAAVTAPLKTIAMSSVETSNLSETCHSLGTLNTLLKIADTSFQWTATNTDFAGFTALTEEAKLQLKITAPQAIVWGGGGTLPVIRKVLANVVEYSVRSARPRNQNEKIDPTDHHLTPGPIDLLIWAAGPHDPFPPEHLRPSLVVDLNYREDSQARTYAKTLSVPYLSGERMFLIQAAHQRIFWKNLAIVPEVSL